jgi:hypothetical protein
MQPLFYRSPDNKINQAGVNRGILLIDRIRDATVYYRTGDAAGAVCQPTLGLEGRCYQCEHLFNAAISSWEYEVSEASRDQLPLVENGRCARKGLGNRGTCTCIRGNGSS